MTASEGRQGLWAALAAYLLWGAFPIYFNRLDHVPAIEVLGHRVVWGAVFTLLAVVAARRLSVLVDALKNRRVVLGLAVSSLCIAINWGFFIWSVGNGHALDASIGYFVNPLFSVLLGWAILKERLGPRQVVALVLVCSGVAMLAHARGGVPWIALILPVTFGFYGLIRKVVAVDALTGLCVETLLLAPLALVFLLSRPEGGAIATGGATTTAMLVLAGPITAIPLVMFAYGARRLKLATLGLMQYVNPTIQMMIAILVFGESVTRAHVLVFVAIWAGLAVYSLPLPSFKGRKGSGGVPR